jgi:hypothetical protein
MRKEITRVAVFMVAMLATRALALAEDQTPGASGLTFVGVAEQGGVVYVSLFDNTTGDHFLPSTKAPNGGYELVSITEDQDAIVRHNGQSYLLRLGWSDGATPVANAPSQASAQLQNIPRPGSDEAVMPTSPPGAKLPLVFQSDQVKGMIFSDDQKVIVTRLRGQFLAAIGAPGSAAVTSAPTADNTTAPTAVTDATSLATTSSAASPTQTWISAQEQSDEIFRMLFGYQAFNAYEMGLGSKP